MDAIDNFLKRIQESQKVKSKEIRLTIQEATELATALSMTLKKNNSLLEQMVQLQDSVIKLNDKVYSSTINPNSDLGMDGGRF